jgi:hypothetical protein
MARTSKGHQNLPWRCLLLLLIMLLFGLKLEQKVPGALEVVKVLAIRSSKESWMNHPWIRIWNHRH